MKAIRNWMPLAWTLVGLLIVAAIMMTLGKRDDRSFPSATSFSPSGSRAFRELLESKGYTVRVETSTLAKIDPDALYVAFLVQRTPSILETPTLLEPKPESKSETEERPSWEDRTVEQDRAAVKPIARVVNGKANVLAIWLPRDFRTASLQARTSSNAESKRFGKLSISTSSELYPPNMGSIVSDDYLEVWTLNQQPCNIIGTVKGVNIGEAYQGLPFTNRFLDQQDNAAFALSTVASMAPPSKKIVFLEDSIGNAVNPGIFAMIGPWASAMWSQITFIFFALILFGSIRFGLAEERRRRQSGTRELVDALGETYARTRSSHLGLKSVYAEYDRQIRAKLKIPADAGPAERNKYLPTSLADAFARAQSLSEDRQSEEVCLTAAINLQKEVESYLGRTPKPPMRKRKKG